MKKVFIGILICFTIFIIIWTTPHVSQNGTIKVWDRNHTLLYESSGSVGKKIPVSYGSFPKSLVDAVVASEDDSFWSNPGIDISAIIRSSALDIQQRKIVSGASTITQQLARISIVSTHESFVESFIRKIREVIIALRLNLEYSKKDILTMYLNQVYFGNLSYGAEAASRTYFNKDVTELSLAESAFLVGLLSSPNNLAKKRQVQVLDLMVKHKFITKDQAEAAKLEVINIAKNTNEIKAPHFVNYVLEELKMLHIDENKGVNIYTTLDYSTYALSQTIAKEWVEKLHDQHDLSNASMVVIKNDTGEIINMLGGIDYFDRENEGEVNMAVSLRQPGSALKPITYAAAFLEGYTPASLIEDVPKVYKTKKGEGYTPNNYDGRYHGLVLVREALASSLNLAAVEMLNRIGIPMFLNVAHKLGITSLNQENRYDLSLTLGGGEVTLLDLTNVYASFARGGKYQLPYAIEKITSDDGGNILFTHKTVLGLQALGKTGEQVAYLITNILADPQARLLGFYEKNPLVLSDRPAAVKTGTTTDWHDNWTIGYTPDYTVGVWVGNNDNHAMKNITGVVGAAPIWNQFFEEFLKGKPAEDFVRPQGIKTVTVCKLTGQLPDSLCPDLINEIFISGTEPKTITSIYKKVHIDIRNNLLAGPSCPSEFTKDEVRINYPPEVYTWAMTNSQDALPEEYSPFCPQKGEPVSQLYVEITYPKAKTVFQNAPDLVSNQGIVFEVNVSSNIIKVQWYVDGKPLSASSDFPYSLSWYPVNGKHTVWAVGETQNGKNTQSDVVSFSVVPYTGY